MLIGSVPFTVVKVSIHTFQINLFKRICFICVLRYKNTDTLRQALNDDRANHKRVSLSFGAFGSKPGTIQLVMPMWISSTQPSSARPKVPLDKTHKRGLQGILCMPVHTCKWFLLTCYRWICSQLLSSLTQFTVVAAVLRHINQMVPYYLCLSKQCRVLVKVKPVSS